MAVPALLLLCGVVAGPLFVIVFIVEGVARDGYNASRQPVSALSLGRGGWMQRTNFVVVGLLMLALAIGLQASVQPRWLSPWLTVLIGVYAIGLIGAGIFVTDPIGGYPPGVGAPSRPTLPGTLHVAFSLAVFIPLAVACFLFAVGQALIPSPGWAVYSAVTGVVFVIGFVLASMGFGQSAVLVPANRLASVGGVLQRVAIIVGWTWLTLVAIHLLLVG